VPKLYAAGSSLHCLAPDTPQQSIRPRHERPSPALLLSGNPGVPTPLTPRIQEKMTLQSQLNALRLLLLDMSKLSHRAVDYAIKGYRLGSPEFSRYVRRGDHQLVELRRTITKLCEKLLMQDSVVVCESPTHGPAVHSNMRFPLTALRICEALDAVCTATAEIAHHTMLLLEDACLPASAALEEVCFLVNRLISLCILALFKKEPRFAETVVYNRDITTLFERALTNLRLDINRRSPVHAALELAIANSLRQITKQTQEIAEAVLFWIEGRSYTVEAIATS
jgi:phosphate uptake regulator